MPEIRAILFDLDGVLVDAKLWHFEAFNHSLMSHGYAPIAYKDHLERFDGLPSRMKLALLARTQPIPAEQYDSINALKQKLTIELAKARCVPDPLHVETLCRLQQDGYAMAVCSNSVRASVDLLLAKAGLIDFFAFTLSNEDVSHPKPHPEMYLAAMQRLAVSPLETLILEDNAYGIEAARASGARVLEIGDSGEVHYDNITRAIKAAAAIQA